MDIEFNKFNWAKVDGELQLKQNEEVNMAKGWNSGLTASERRVCHAHNLKLQKRKAKEIEKRYSAMASSTPNPCFKKAPKGATLIGRFQHLEEQMLHVALDEIEGSELVPLDQFNKQSIERRRAQIASWKDLLVMADKLRDMKNTLVDDFNDTGVAEEVDQKLADLESLRKELKGKVVNLNAKSKS